MMIRNAPLKKQTGLTLLELVVGLGLMVFLLGGSIMWYAAATKSFYGMIAVNSLDQQLRGAVNLMVGDIRRAGYSANAVTDINSGANTNPFMAAGNDINSPSSTCILLTYDSDSSGLMPALNAVGYDKRFAFRLSQGVLQSRPPTDTIFNCTANNWVNITDPNIINISALNFTLTPTVITLSNGVSTVTIRNVTISMTGNLIQDPTVARTITANIRVRNDKFQP